MSGAFYMWKTNEKGFTDNVSEAQAGNRLDRWAGVSANILAKGRQKTSPAFAGDFLFINIIYNTKPCFFFFVDTS